MMSQKKATMLQQKKKADAKRRREMAEDHVVDRADEEYERKNDVGAGAIHDLINDGNDSDAEEDDDVEEAARAKREPLKWNMKSFLRTAGNGTLFRKHKYRRRWDDASRYQPKEV